VVDIKGEAFDAARAARRLALDEVRKFGLRQQKQSPLEYQAAKDALREAENRLAVAEREYQAVASPPPAVGFSALERPQAPARTGGR
jgi:hypothetical protein